MSWKVLDKYGNVKQAETVTVVLPDGTYGDIAVSSSGTVWTLIASISKAVTGLWSFVTNKLRLYNIGQTYYHEFAGAATANRTVTFPDKTMTVAGTNDKLSAFAATTSAELAGVVSDETGSGALVFGTTPTVNQPNIVGTTTNDNAAAGSVGETITQSRVQSAATALTTATVANVTATALTLTAGDWDISAMVGFLYGTGTNVTVLRSGISLTSATNPAADTFGVPTSGEVRLSHANVTVGTVRTTGGYDVFGIPQYRVSISGSTTFYLICLATFTVSTCSAFGSITARRVR